MKTVHQLLKEKGSRVLTTTPDTSIYEALEVMAEMEIGALVVTEGDRVAGIFSERDYARSVVLKGKSSMKTPIREVMTGKVITITPEDLVEDCMNLMTDKHIRHLPVLKDGKLVGLLSIGDIVKETITHQRYLIHELEKYIKS